VARSYRAVFSSGFERPEHTHPWRQLLYAASGAMTVRAGPSTWLIPPGKAVGIPAACRRSSACGARSTCVCDLAPKGRRTLWCNGLAGKPP
jgi:quercetin dioxygenase-like cupin family protein